MPNIPKTIYEMQRIDANGDIVEDIIPKTESIATKYTDSIPVDKTIGGIEEGTIYEDTDLQTIMNSLLHPYVKPVVTIESSENQFENEKGQELNIQIKANIIKKSENIKKVELCDKNNNIIETINTPNPSGGIETFDLDIVTNDISLKIVVTDIKDGIVESDLLEYFFVYPIYIGVGDNLNKLVITKPDSVKYTYTLDKNNMSIIVPNDYEITKILDNNGLDIINSYSIEDKVITCLDQTNQTYKHYKSGITTQEDFNITYIF